MGRPGGFFKKLKAKQKKTASRNQRGTKGASKEDRRRKHNERVEVFAAKREAEQLAVVSSSSDDEPSTDSDAEARRATRSMRRLRAMLGAEEAPNHTAAAAREKATASAHKRLRTEGKVDGPVVDDDVGSEDGWDSSDSEAAAKAAARRPPPRRLRCDAARQRGAAAPGDDGDDELDGEDWRLYLGQGSSGSEDDEEGDDQELGEETDDADDVVDQDLLMDINEEEEDEDDDEAAEEDDEEDDEEDEEGGENPLFDLEDGEGSNGQPGEDEDDDGADLFDDVMMFDEEGEEDGEEDEEGGENPLFDLEDGEGSNGQPGEDEDDDGADLFDDVMMFDEEGEGAGEEGEEDEDEEEEKEEAFVDDEASEEDDNENADSPKKNAKRTVDPSATAEQRQLLQTFQFHTSSVSVLQEHGDGALSEKDEWVRKYHLDLHGLVDETPMKPLPVPHAAVELLAESNAPLTARAAEMMATTVDKKQLGLFFVSAEEYAVMHPENVAVLASAHVQQHLLHPPFDVAAEAGWTRCPPYVHPALWEKWSAFRSGKNMPTFTVEERGLLDLLQGYPDVLDTLHCWQNSESRREIHALHLLNHWFKARSVVLAHDALLAKRKQAQRARRKQQWARRKQQEQQRNNDEGSEASHAQESSPVKGEKETAKKKKKGASPKKAAEPVAVEEEDEDEAAMDDDGDLELRDRGFSKTRLCVLCPLRNHAYKFVYTLVSILQADPEKCPKLAMFEQDFTEIEEALDPTFRRRPRDYQRAFEGNIDDSFCVGLRLEPERVHVYAHPLNSDLLICSPLGLRRRIEKNGDVLVSLSSIEVCLLEEAQMLYQQNWMHVTAVLDLLNKRPTDTTHGLSDLRRVYSWALEGKSGRHRQTIVSTEVSNATILSTFRTTSVNNSGKVLLQRRADPGVLSRVLVPVRQHFIRFDPTSLATVDDDRFEFFTKQMYQTKINAMAERDVRVIIFVPSYFDFVRVRNYLHREYRESYAAISEYTSLKQQRKALGQFSDLERPVLLVTERFYFFKRYFVKMAEALVFYSPPMFPEYYASLTNRLVATSPNAFAMTLYCRYDTHELNRLVGTSRMVQLLERESGVFSFVTS